MNLPHFLSPFNTIITIKPHISVSYISYYTVIKYSRDTTHTERERQLKGMHMQVFFI